MSDPATAALRALTRRSFLTVASAVALAGVLPGCGVRQGRPPLDEPEPAPASALTARPGDTVTEPFEGSGTHALELEQERDALVHVPPGLAPDRPAPLVIALHGAGGDAEGGLAPLRAHADQHGLVLLAPASREATWDAIRGGYGPDVRLIDRALERVFRGVAVDGERIAVAGFSDGASYALGLGLANAGLCRRIMAFSPGFVPPSRRDGRRRDESLREPSPSVFISHGTADDVLPIESTSRTMVPALREEGLDVTYREFAGGHVVPPEIVEEAMAWLGWGRPA